MPAKKNSRPHPSTAPAREGSHSAAPRNYEAHAQEIAATMGWFMLRHLHRVREAFDGDFLLAIILGEIAHHNICHYYSAGRRIQSARGVDYEGPNGLPHLEGCNAYSLSIATGIPRETVRRKAFELVKRGWVKRDERGGFLVTPDAFRQFSPDLNVRSLTDFLETAVALRMILESGASQEK